MTKPDFPPTPPALYIAICVAKGFCARDAAQRSLRTFYEAIKLDFGQY
jgi:hypothetical protein